MHILDVGLEHLPRRKGVNSALDEVCRVENAFELREGLKKIQTALGIVAVDALLVFVAEGDVVVGSHLHKLANSVYNGAAVFVLLALGDVEREHTDVLRT